MTPPVLAWAPAQRVFTLFREFGQLEHRDENAIKERAARLAARALEVWMSPKLPASVLDAYRARVPAAAYSIDDHPNLQSGPMRDLFEAFRREVLALDPCVTEEFLKSHVAYKAETNFVGIAPQKKQLQLLLNMPLQKLNDPQGICKDMSSPGHCEVGLSSIDQLPYVMGLVRQSLERQLGDGGDE